MATTLNKLVSPEMVIQFQMSAGFFCILMGIVSAIVFFLKVSQKYSPLFLLLIIPGILLVRRARRAVLNEKIEL
ncbi:hypothetical protein HY638_03025 [Candidatus Woesearchaeota archaeon]|nr:hypothetical protein [Candidatus Woesearchaeota archaeon]